MLRSNTKPVKNRSCRVVLTGFVSKLPALILGKGVPFVPVAMQHGATEDVLLWQKCALCATRMRVVRDRGVRCAQTLHSSLQPTEGVSHAARWCEYLNPSLYRTCNTSYVRSASKYVCVTCTETVVLSTLVTPKLDSATRVGAFNLVIQILKNT